MIPMYKFMLFPDDDENSVLHDPIREQ